MSNIKKGDKVWWEDDGYLLSGSVSYLLDGDEAMVLTDCGKVETLVWVQSLNKAYWLEQAKDFAEKNDCFECPTCGEQVISDDMLQ